MDRVSIDGSLFEGGGQILRNSAALAIICGRSLEVYSIRARRPKPGLMNQHRVGLQLASRLCAGELNGCVFQSNRIELFPRQIKGGDYECDARTAGSVALIIQITAPVLAFGDSPSNLTLFGGTDADFAPLIDYMKDVTSFYYQKFGLNFSVEVVERGYFPKGGGVVKVRVEPSKETLSPVNLTDFGTVTKVFGSTFVAGNLSSKEAFEMRSIAKAKFESYFPDTPCEIEAFRAKDNKFKATARVFLLGVETSTGCRLAVTRVTISRALQVKDWIESAIDAELMPLVEAGACCDAHMQDQLILLMAVARGQSEVRTTELTLHTKSAIYVVEQMLPDVKFTAEATPDGKAVLLSCTGAGIQPKK